MNTRDQSLVYMYVCFVFSCSITPLFSCTTTGAEKPRDTFGDFEFEKNAQTGVCTHAYFASSSMHNNKFIRQLP